ncbi:MAG: RNA polymerase factor sigma-54 [Pseudomonadales bacterium]|nr:RNA polymerase factor sigma-54 [Pseudomonadales bacterium]
MKQALQLKIGQSLTMTPQLQQAIRLLQLSALEMEQEIQEALESNPMLEVAEEDYDDRPDGSDPNVTDTPESATAASDEPTGDDRIADGAEDFANEDASGAEGNAEGEDYAGLDGQSLGNEDWDGGPGRGDDAADADGDAAADSDWQQSDIPEDLPVDSSWDDVYAAAPAAGPPPEEELDYGSRTAAATSLTDHLIWQLGLTNASAEDREIALALIDSVDADGMLRVSLEEIAADFDAAREIGVEEVEMVLHMLQQFDPTGVCARDLRECLLLQLRDVPDGTPWLEEARTLLSNHMDLLAARDYPTLLRRTRLEENQLSDVMRLIQTLNPRPGSAVSSEEVEYVVPDVVVRKDKRRWLVELNGESTPRLRINADYAALVRRADSSADNQFLKNNLQEARWFLKSVQSRNETLLKVATCIVQHQRGFLDYGPEAMKPLVLADIADAIGMHESTISRVTTRKYMHTPRGIFELKYFFSSHVGTASGGEVSSTAIRALIRKLTDEENPRKPLSDSRIAQLLAEQEIKVARRTIAKYRESMAIPPSNERKRLV